MTEYSRMAKGNYTVTGGSVGVSAPSAQVINLPFKPDYVELINYTAALTPTDDGIPFAFWDASVNVTVSAVSYNPTVVQQFNGTPVLSTDLVLTNGISAFSGGLLLQYGPVNQHGSAITDFSISKASPAVITTTNAHGLSSGDVVIFEGLFQTATTGMPQINGIPFTVTVTAATTFTIPWDTSGSNYTAFNTSTSTGNIGAYKKVLYPYLYFPGQSFIGSITLGATTTISTTDAHNFVVGQEVAIRMPKQWGTVELNSLPNVTIPGSPIYGYVVAVTDYHTVVVNINSAAFTAFTVNQTVASVPGLSYPQIVAVGDVNAGGVLISAGSPLYPSPQFIPIGTTAFSTINGPAIRGAYVNNTAQGFVVGPGAANSDTTAFLGGQSGDVMEWRAYYHDLSIP